MKKNTLKESEIPIDMKFMREFRAEMMSRFSAQDEHLKKLGARADEHDSRFDRVDARFDQMDAKIDKAIAEMKAIFHQAMLIFEEQNLRNKQAYDAATVTYEALQDLKGSLKPDCFKSS